jgi:hypothetical protein
VHKYGSKALIEAAGRESCSNICTEGDGASLCLVTAAKRCGTVLYLCAACGRMLADTPPESRLKLSTRRGWLVEPTQNPRPSDRTGRLSSWQIRPFPVRCTIMGTLKPLQGIALLCVVVGVPFLFTGCMVTNSPPRASFTMSPSSGQAPLTVAFNASSSSDSDGHITSYSWAFGDDSTGSGVTTSHTYGTAGAYVAMLTVRDNGDDVDVETHSITVSQPSAPLPPPGPAVAFRVTTSQILAEFEANEVAAEMKYEDGRLAVSGYIERFDTYMVGDLPIVTLGSEPGGSVFDDEVLCYFPIAQRPSVAQLAKGDYVTIVGEYWMYGLGNVYVHYCYVE